MTSVYFSQDRFDGQTKREVRWRNVVGALLCIFLPGLALLAATYGAIWGLKSIR